MGTQLQSNFMIPRVLYYENLDFFKNQNCVDRAMETISMMLSVPQWKLGVIASSQGLVAGPLKIKFSPNTEVDCSVAGGAPIPYGVTESTELVTSAKYVILVEKDTAFKRLIMDDVQTQIGPCILITGCGFPDTITRYFVKLVWDQLKIPIFAVVDANPSGMEIMFNYRFGSKNLSHLTDVLAVPSVRWLGLHATDVFDLNLKTIPLTRRDVKRATRILSRNYVKENENLKNQVNFMIARKVKSELENVAQLSTGYLARVYIPMKINNRIYI